MCQTVNGMRYAAARPANILVHSAGVKVIILFIYVSISVASDQKSMSWCLLHLLEQGKDSKELSNSRN